ncbi:MAG: oligosaccharide flippase family protein [Acetobacteraceae bacterium]|nr:oligosaccharide flippase family protein [Acetobacteraceae bacterium]
MRSGRLLRETAILAAAGLGCKLLGGLSKLPLAWMLGAHGIGVFQLAFTFYGLTLALAVSGFPVAASKLVAERTAVGDSAGARAGFRLAYALLFAIGALASAALYFGAPGVAALLRNPHVSGPLKATAPAVLLVALAAAYRGYFQGHRRLIPTAVSQLAEQAVRVAAMLALAYLLRPRGLVPAVTGASLGSTLGALAALLVVGWLYHIGGRLGGGTDGGFRRRGGGVRSRRTPGRRGRLRPVPWHPPPPAPPPAWRLRGRGPGAGALLRSLAATAAPVSAGSAVLPVTEAAVAVIVLARLQAAGYTSLGATHLYGELYGLAYSLVTLPAIAAAALAAALVPAVAGAVAAGDLRRAATYARSSLRLTVVGSLPAALGMYLLAAPLCGLLFGVREAGAALAPLAPAALLIALQQTTTGLLQGLGRPVVPVVGMVLGGLANAALAYWLTAIPSLGIAGAAGAVVGGYAVAVGVNLACLLGRPGFWPALGDAAAKPFIACWLMALAVQRAHPALARTLGQGVGVLLAVVVGSAVYAAAMLVMRGFSRQELELVPGIGAGLARRFGKR